MRQMLENAVATCIHVDDTAKYAQGILSDCEERLAAVKAARLHQLISIEPAVLVRAEANLDELKGFVSLAETAAKDCQRLKRQAREMLAAYLVGCALPVVDKTAMQELQDNFRETLREISANSTEAIIIYDMVEKLDEQLSKI